eukprot:GEMP01063073.1.p1 GENE.GEMP01063073.1~~GEMP01063073.1.p1  ORF type:complete len:400 (+),score=84.26 GEMP01063073.1:149-1348(+)
MALAMDSSKVPTVNTCVLKPLVRPTILAQVAGYKRGFDVLEDEKRNNRQSKYRQSVRLSAKKSGVLDMDWSTDGRCLLILTPDGLRTVDTERDTGREDRVVAGTFVAAKVDPTNANIIAAVCTEGRLHVLKILPEGGIRCLQNADLEKTNKAMKNFTGLAYSPTGELIALSTARNEIFTFSVVKAEQKGHLELHTQGAFDVPATSSKQISAMQFDVTGEYLWVATATVPGKIWRYCVSTRRITPQSLTANQGPTLCLCADRSGKYFAAGGADGLISIWDAKTVEQVASITKPDQAVSKLTLNFDGSLVAWSTPNFSSDYQGARWFYVADVQTRQVIFADHQRTPVCNIKWCPRNNRLAYFCEEEDTTTQASATRFGDRNRVSVQATLRQVNIVRVPDRM